MRNRHLIFVGSHASDFRMETRQKWTSRALWQGRVRREETLELGCRLPIQGSGFRVQGSGFRVQVAGFRVETGGGCLQVTTQWTISEVSQSLSSPPGNPEACRWVSYRLYRGSTVLGAERQRWSEEWPRQTTRCSTTLSSQVNLHPAINFRALCGANLVT